MSNVECLWFSPLVPIHLPIPMPNSFCDHFEHPVSSSARGQHGFLAPKQFLAFFLRHLVFLRMKPKYFLNTQHVFSYQPTVCWRFFHTMPPHQNSLFRTRRVPRERAEVFDQGPTGGLSQSDEARILVMMQLLH